MKISGWIGNRLFNPTRGGGRVGRGIAAVGKHASKPLIGLTAVTQLACWYSDKVSEKIDQVTDFPELTLLGIATSSLLLLGLSKLSTKTGWEVRSAKKYIEEAEKARREGDFNNLFLAALELKKLGDRLGEQSYLNQYEQYRGNIFDAYFYERVYAEGPPVNFNVVFKEYLVACNLDRFNSRFDSELFRGAAAVGQMIQESFNHPLGRESQIRALRELYQEYLSAGNRQQAEEVLTQLFVLGDQEAAEQKSVLYAE